MAGINEHVKLLGHRSSPFVNRVQFALNLKSVNYEFILENFSEKSELLQRCNPVHKKVPVLIHGDKPICESLVILEYIDDIWSDGLSILPYDPYHRSASRFWAAYVDDKLVTMLPELRLAKEESKTSVLERAFEALTLLEEVFLKFSCSSVKGIFFGGDNIGYLDMVLGSYLGWVKLVETITNLKILEETKIPVLVEWAERFTSHQAVRGILMEPEELFPVLQQRLAREAANSSSE